MNKLSPFLLGLSLAVSGISVTAAHAQSMAAASAPNYLQVIVEYPKPGKGGMAHDKTEGAFVQAMAKAKFPIHYIAFNALSGQPRAIFLSAFDSFDQFQKVNKIFAAPATAAEFERLNVADGDLLTSTNQLIFSYAPELSYHSKAPTGNMRYLEAEIFHVHPGHRKEFIELTKLWMAALDKAGSTAHWGAWRLEYGGEMGSYVFLTGDDSGADIDKGFAEDPKVMAVLSDDDKKKMNELAAAAIDTNRSELYAVNPVQSYPPESFVKADPGFWTPKAAAAKPATKPAKK